MAACHDVVGDDTLCSCNRGVRCQHKSKVIPARRNFIAAVNVPTKKPLVKIPSKLLMKINDKW